VSQHLEVVRELKAKMMDFVEALDMAESKLDSMTNSMGEVSDAARYYNNNSDTKMLIISYSTLTSTLYFVQPPLDRSSITKLWRVRYCYHT